MDLMVLLKCLYLADRMSLQKTGFPITGDRMVSMDWGPVLSSTYDETKKKRQANPDDLWFEYVSERKNHTLFAVKENPETDELSKFERGVLTEVHAEFGDKDPFAISDWTHD